MIEPSSVGVHQAAETQLQSEVVARRIREAIVSGKLEPGDRIRQETFARELGISRIPVREALHQLESEGLVTLIPHAGARVARVDSKELQEMYRIREALEPMVIGESCPHLSERQLRDLRTVVEEIEQLVDEPERWLEADRRFHLATYDGADMPRARSLVDGFWNRTQHYRRAHIMALDLSQFEIVHLEHRLILDALERRSSDDASSAILTHIRRTRQALLSRDDGFDQPIT